MTWMRLYRATIQGRLKPISLRLLKQTPSTSQAKGQYSSSPPAASISRVNQHLKPEPHHLTLWPSPAQLSTNLRSSLSLSHPGLVHTSSSVQQSQVWRLITSNHTFTSTVSHQLNLNPFWWALVDWDQPLLLIKTFSIVELCVLVNLFNLASTIKLYRIFNFFFLLTFQLHSFQPNLIINKDRQFVSQICPSIFQT